MVAEHLDVLVIVVDPFVDVADSAAIQENVREFMNQREDASINAILDVDDDRWQRSFRNREPARFSDLNVRCLKGQCSNGLKSSAPLSECLVLILPASLHFKRNV